MSELQRCAGNAAVARRLSSAPATVARAADGDATTACIDASFAQALDDDELAEQVRRLEAGIGELTDPGERSAYEENLAVLRAERARRAPGPGGGRHAEGVVPRPDALPLDQGFQLIPVPNLPPELVEQIPEGELVELGAGGVVGAGGLNVPRVLETTGSTLGGGIIGGNMAAQRVGFAAAGEHAIGLVAIPRTQSPFRGSLFGRGPGWNPLSGVNPGANPVIDLARPLDSWGHTAMYVRQNGRITWVRGFGPDMSLGQLPGFARASRGVGAGTAAWPGVVEGDASLFRSTMARSLEYPVEQALADAVVGRHPTGGGGAGGAPTHFTARPNVYASARGGPTLMCANQNCVMYAVGHVEGHLGGPVGRPGAGSVVNQGGTGSASIGRLYGLMGEAESGGALSRPTGATGPPVAGSMPTGLRFLKWGGRVFVVIGVAAGAYEIHDAPPEQKARTTAGVVGGFGGGIAGAAAGGAAAGATAGLVCGPGAPVCSIVLGIGGGLIGGLIGAFAGRAVAEDMYDDLSGSGDRPPCPSCHSQLRAAENRDRLSFDNPQLLLGAALTSSPLGAAGGQERTLSEAEIQLILEFVGEPSPPDGPECVAE